MSKLPQKKLSRDILKKLQDLSPALKEVTIDKEGWCYTYRDKSELGAAIYKDFVNYNRARGGKKSSSFIYSEDFEESGILSQLQAIQTLAMLVESFDKTLDVAKDKDKNGNECESEAEMFRGLLTEILNKLEPEPNVFHFDATPYLPNSSQFNDSAYLDTVTWFVSAACSVFRLMIQKGLEIEPETESKLVRLFKYCMKYLTDSFIDNGKKGAFSCGWNYINGCKEPSLYFTFAVTEVLIDVFSTFETVIKDAEYRLVQSEIDKKFAEFGSRYEEEIAAKKDQVKLTFVEYKKQEKKTVEQIEREKELFKQVNNGFEVFEIGSLYKLLEEQCKKAGNNVWSLTKDKLARGFFASDLVSDLSETVIEQSITTDALFNSVFVLNIAMNAGLDEDAEDLINYYTLNGSDEYEKATEDYDEMRDIMRLGYDNTYQMYVKLRKEKKEYKVNEFILSFVEDFGEAFTERIKELRKARIRVFSLMPLLVKTKTTMSEFVIRYPQYDMQLYLEQILEHRLKDEKGETQWIWERDGYSASSNYYFLSALRDFYAYYEEYEQEYSENAYENEREKEKIKAEQLKELEAKGAIHDLKERIKTLEINNQKNQEKVAALEKEPLRYALTEFIQNAIKDKISELVSDMFKDMAEKLVADAKAGFAPAEDKETTPEEVQAKEAANHFGSSVSDLVLAMLATQMVDVLKRDKDHVREENFNAEFGKLDRYTRRDFAEVLRLYLGQLVSGRPSEFVTTKGYEGLPGVLEANVNKKNKPN